LHELEAFVGLQRGSPINPGGALALVVLGHASDGQVACRA